MEDIRKFIKIIEESMDQNFDDVNEGPISKALKIGAFFQTTALFNVPPEAFDIKPKVQSTLMRLIPRKEEKISLSQYPAFSAFVDMAFANKRKNIKNNLKKISLDLEKLNINPLARAEELSLDDFVAMFKSSLL